MNHDELLLETPRFRVVRREYQLADGSTHEREAILHPGAVTLLPLLEGDRICLIRNYRPAVGQTLLELPAGTLEEGESPQQTARRELQEETGYTALNLQLLTEFYMSPGILDERMYLFAATGLQKGARQLDAGEQIEPLTVGWEAALEMIAAGEIQDAKTLAGLLFYERYRRAR